MNRSISASLFLCGSILLLATALFAQQTAVDYTKWVNPFIGTGGHGHTFPGATMPFGMVQLSPDTRIDNWDGSSGYHYSDDTIFGFSHLHLSGTGIPDGCDILFTPVTDDLRTLADQKDKVREIAASKFSHADEKAEPGYYSVKLANNIFAEMTASPRIGLHRYTFPAGSKAGIIIDLKWRDKVLGSGLKVIAPNRIEGYRRSSSWAKDQIIYFVVEFSSPFELVATDKSNNNTDRVYLEFQPGADRQVSAKVALSYTSTEGAASNLLRDMNRSDSFDSIRAKSKESWNKVLGKIEVKGGTDAQMTTFYSALYHTMIQPNLASDVDKKYRGGDGEVKRPLMTNLPMSAIGLANRDVEMMRGYGRYFDGHHYTVFSLWDTFRAAHPLYTIIDQQQTVDFINTFIRQYQEGGRLPVWELWGNETDCMIGYHAVSVIADAMAKGIKGFDYEKAYAAAKHSAELDHYGLAAYKKRGYISMEDENESVSKTLEYAYDDWCIAQMADVISDLSIYKHEFGEAIKSRDDSKIYSKRARSFENLFDPSTGFMRPKKNGGFVSPFAPNEVTFNFTEGNSWVYSFFVPQDVSRLMELQGGKEKFSAKLDDLFSTTDKLAGREQPDITGLIGQYAHGNEPSHHIAYLYDYTGQPWKTQSLVRKIMDEFYKPEPNGLIGNEDCGQMSAWYIMSAAGIYEVTPGSAIYAFGTPLFPELKFNLENGKTFTVKAKGVSAKNIYIRSAKLNGAAYKKAFLNHEDLMKGGILEFEMTDKPVETAFTEFPVSSIKADAVAVPQIEGSPVFAGKQTITLRSIDPNAKITYTTDNYGEEYARKTQDYTRPFKIHETLRVEAYATDPKTGAKSPVVVSEFRKRPNDWTVKIDHPYNRQYTGGGDLGLIDGIRGTVNFASGEWQGYQPYDLVAAVDLQRPTEIKKVGGGFLQDARSWIWMPTHIVFEVSDNGSDWKQVADIKTDVAADDMKVQMKDYTASIPPVTTRYVRVHAYNLGKIPAWHPGAGDDCFIFVDELIIQ